MMHTSTPESGFTSATRTRTGKIVATTIALAVAILAGAARSAIAHFSPAAAGPSQQAATQSKFYCNIAALTPTERARHTWLTAKLMAARKEIVESPKGYEFQFSPSDVTLAELAEWVVAEAKCCPFFDFHLDLENEGKQLCLRLTGDEGIKAFIQSEFHVPAK
jgi:hypothetical protein